MILGIAAGMRCLQWHSTTGDFMTDEDEIKKKIKEAYQDGNQVKHHTKVYVSILVVMVVLIAGYILLTPNASDMIFGTGGNAGVKNSDDAMHRTSDIGGNISSIMNDLDDISNTLS
jgi:hypothetical protein